MTKANVNVYYMFQTQDDTIGQEEEIYEQFQSEFRSVCKDPVYFTSMTNDGHGMGVGDWSDIGEAFDWGVKIVMSRRDFEALKDTYGLLNEDDPDY